MKKIVALTLAALLVFSIGFAFAATYTAGKYYTMDYDAHAFWLDNTSNTEENTDDYKWLYMLYDDNMVIDAVLVPAYGYEGVNLYEADEDEREAYVAETLESFAEYNAVYVDALTSVSGYPFYIFSMEDEDGPYYFGETIIGGTSVNLNCYYSDKTAEPDDALLEALEELLITIRPAEPEEEHKIGTDI